MPPTGPIAFTRRPGNRGSDRASDPASCTNRRHPRRLRAVANETIRADEDELCALYLRARLEGRQPDVAAIRAVLATMPPPPNPKPVTAGAYDLKDRENAAEVDAIAFAISVRLEGGLLIAEAERNDLLPAS